MTICSFLFLLLYFLEPKSFEKLFIEISIENEAINYLILEVWAKMDFYYYFIVI